MTNGREPSEYRRSSKTPPETAEDYQGYYGSVPYGPPIKPGSGFGIPSAAAGPATAGSWTAGPESGVGLGIVDAVGGPSVPRLAAPVVLATLAGVVAALFGSRIEIAIGCWLIAGPVAILLLALFAKHDTVQRARAVYAAPRWVVPLHRCVMALILLAVLVSAWRIADWAGRL